MRSRVDTRARKARRRFSPHQKESVLARQNMICACGCGEPLVIGQIQYDHDKSLWLDGPDTLENLRALIKKHHLVKTNAEATIRAKNDRMKAKHDGTWLSREDRQIARIRERKEARGA